MGQYYKATLKQKGTKNWVSFASWDFEAGAKLMEHSYIGNNFVDYVKKLIFNTPTRVVWAGDYADNEKGMDSNLYELVEATNPKDKNVSVALKFKIYLVNETKEMYIDYSKVKKDAFGYRIDPMPLLCAEGNGRGGGDYEGSSMELIGSWARDLVYVTDEIPSGYKEIVPDFVEGKVTRVEMEKHPILGIDVIATETVAENGVITEMKDYTTPRRKILNHLI